MSNEKVARVDWKRSYYAEAIKSDALRKECEAQRKDAELLAWVLAHPETAAECLEDAAAGDGTARSNLERRIAGIAAAMARRALGAA